MRVAEKTGFSKKDIHDVEKEIIPTTQHTLSTAIQNFLLKKRIVYGKLSWNGLQPTVHQMGKLASHIYPKILMIKFI